ncbi:hypothetical protein Agub_g12116, partial [Astrephomene gubernaculifera]
FNMMPLLVPVSVLPVPLFMGSGCHFSNQCLQRAAYAHAERLLAHRRGCERYRDAVAFTAWKLQRRMKRDVGYKMWALYNDCTTLYTLYWRVCCLLTAISRLVNISSSSGSSSGASDGGGSPWGGD